MDDVIGVVKKGDTNYRQVVPPPPTQQPSHEAKRVLRNRRLLFIDSTFKSFCAIFEN